MRTKLVNGVRIPLNQNEASQLDKEQRKWEEQYEKEVYKYLRRKNYPSIEDQLDLIFHQGLKAWKAQIAQIKEAFPKPKNKEDLTNNG